MAEKDKIFSGKIKSKMIFDFAELYRFTYSWFIDEGYWLTENVYSEKIQPNGKEVKIEWECHKKISDYFKNHMKVKWRILGMKDVEVEKDGDKLTMQKGSLEIAITTTLVKDYESRWEDVAFLKFLRGVYDRYIIRGRVESYEDKAFGDADEFLSQTKAFLALEGKH